PNRTTYRALPGCVGATMRPRGYDIWPLGRQICRDGKDCHPCTLSTVRRRGRATGPTRRQARALVPPLTPSYRHRPGTAVPLDNPATLTYACEDTGGRDRLKSLAGRRPRGPLRRAARAPGDDGGPAGAVSTREQDPPS